MSKKTSAIGKIYQALIYVFLYAPILVIGLFSFNGSANTYMLQGFSTHWYKELFSNAAAMHALQNTVVLALCTAAVSTLFLAECRQMNLVVAVTPDIQTVTINPHFT